MPNLIIANAVTGKSTTPGFFRGIDRKFAEMEIQDPRHGAFPNHSALCRLKLRKEGIQPMNTRCFC